jgi:hypothetical protein
MAGLKAEGGSSSSEEETGGARLLLCWLWLEQLPFPSLSLPPQMDWAVASPAFLPFSPQLRVALLENFWQPISFLFKLNYL